MNVGLDPAPLATEALRGDGAILVNGRGERFMLALDPRGDLSPRDIVARGVFAEVASGRGAFLDCRNAIGAHFAESFPTVYAHCRNAGIDPVSDLIPVAPAVHYHMGGIATDEFARTSAPGLWAIGEVASTGLHGGNRLASNSLLEAVVFGARAARHIRSLDRNRRRAPTIDLKRIASAGCLADAGRGPAVARLRRTMSGYVGVERTHASLAHAISVMAEIEHAAGADSVLANMALAARFVAGSALLREETRGAHARSDFPVTRPEFATRSFLTLAELDALGQATHTEPRKAQACR
jgi:L-aspartate oxidase